MPKQSYFEAWLSRSFGWHFAAGRRSVVFWRSAGPGRRRRFAVERPHPGQLRIAVGYQRVTLSQRRLWRTWTRSGRHD